MYLTLNRYMVPNPSYKGKAKKQKQQPAPESLASPAAAAGSQQEQDAAPHKHHHEVTVQVVPADRTSAAGTGRPSAGGAAGEDDHEDVPKELTLLKGITGYAEPGMLMALMGGSGNRALGVCCGCLEVHSACSECDGRKLMTGPAPPLQTMCSCLLIAGTVVVTGDIAFNGRNFLIL